ncbi:hypothetical protein [Streptosporangium sp. NPDC006007]|uniref:hypothetical protein n=1 Tax=Streptosporangium sp. NPDC006007 TaxID=3154575 RepID=UPI00339F3969
MTAPDEHGPTLEMARAVRAACDAAREALAVIDTALSTGNRLGVAVFGFAALMNTRGPLRALADEHGPARVLADNEIKALSTDTTGRTA